MHEPGSEARSVLEKFVAGVTHNSYKIPDDTVFHCAQAPGLIPLVFRMTSVDGVEIATVRETQAMAQHMGLAYVSERDAELMLNIKE